jgi:hypothetical protein
MFNKLRLWLLEQQVKVMLGEEPKKAPVKKKAPAKKTAVKKTTKKK